MSDISKEIRNLSPEKRELLELLLEEEGIKVDSALILSQERNWNQELGGYQMPMSFAQQRLWFLNQFSPDSSFIPEIWQGHENNGEGFWMALENLEKAFQTPMCSQN